MKPTAQTRDENIVASKLFYYLIYNSVNKNEKAKYQKMKTTVMNISFQQQSND